MKSVLIIEDDELMSKTIARIINTEFHSLQASSGAEGLHLASQRKPDLILLDLNLPDTSGLDLCRRLRSEKQTAEVPIIMLTGMSAPDACVAGFETGADDYLSKPFHTGELLARIRARLRDKAPIKAENAEFRIANLTFLLESQTAWISEQRISLTHFEFRMLLYFAERAGKLIDRATCLADLWPGTVVSGRTIDTHIARLRRKVTGFQGELRTVHRAGYILEANSKAS